MKKLLVLMALLIALVVGTMPAVAITWGELDTEHTNVGAMVVDWPGYGPAQMCSGTLIHPRVFLFPSVSIGNLHARLLWTPMGSRPSG